MKRLLLVLVLCCGCEPTPQGRSNRAASGIQLVKDQSGICFAVATNGSSGIAILQIDCKYVDAEVSDE